MASSASITGVFTILDRASGPMRKMEAQAAKTMAAIEGVGAALDAQKQSGFAQETEKLTRGFRNVERSGGLAARAMGMFGRETSKTNKETSAFVTGMQKIRDVAGGLVGILGGLKFGVLAAGIGVAVQAVGALAGGVIALIPRLTDLVGVLAAAPAAAGAFVQSMGTVMLALKPAMAAISAGFKEASKSTDPFQAAMEKLSPQARTFVKEVIAMRPAFQRLQNAAGIKLFPQLSASLKDISKLFPTVQRNLTATGGVVGRSISGIAGDLSSTARIGDINTIMQSQTRIAGMAGNGIRNLVSALMDFMVAAAPFSEWLFKTVEGWTEVAKASAKAGRETGGIANYLDRTRSSLELFGGILKDTWEIMMALGKAARPLGDRLWGGAARATRGWADFLKSAEGANKARGWFDSLYEPLHALGQLAKEVSVALFGMTRDTSALTETTKALQGAVPALARLFQGASEAFGPSVARSLTAISELLAALPWSPLKLVVDALTQMLVIITTLVKEIPGLGLVISTVMTVALGTKLLGAVSRLGALAGMWNTIAAAATRAGIAQQAASMAGMGGLMGRGGRGGYTATTGPLAGMVGVGGKAPTSGGLLGGLRGGGAGVGLGIGLGGGLLASMAGSAIGGDAGSKVSSIGGMAATGAGIGSVVPGVGTLVGALAGAAAGAILGGVTSGLFKGADSAQEAGKKAGEEYLKGLGIAGIDPKTGRPWAPGTNPNESRANRIAARQTALAQARANLEAAGGTLGTRGAAGQTGARAQVLALDRAERNSVAAFVEGVTGPRNERFLDTAKYVVQDFVKMFDQLGPQAKQSGAKSLLQWARGMESRGQATKGFTRQVFRGIANEFSFIEERFGGSGRKALQRFNAEMRADKSRSAMARLVNTMSGDWEGLYKLPAATAGNWESQFNKQVDFLKARIRNSGLKDEERSKARRDLAELQRQARRTRAAINAALAPPTLQTGYAPGQGYQRFDAKRGTGGPLAPASQRARQGGGIFGDPFAALRNAKPPTFPRPNMKPAEDRVRSSTSRMKTQFGNLPGAVKTAGDRVGANARTMASNYNLALGSMTSQTNSLLSGLGAETISVGGGRRQETGGRLTAGGPVFAAGGRIPGRPRGDHIPLVGRGGSLLGIADGGELVVNRHTENRVNGMLATHGTSLGREVAGEKKPHWRNGPGFATGGRVNAPTMSGASNPLSMGAQRAANAMFERVAQAANKKIEREQEKVMASAGGAGSTKGLVAQVLRALAFARANGWTGGVTSGWRSRAEQAVLYQRWLNGTGNRAAPPGQSNHESGQAVDITDTEGFARAMAKAPANAKLLRGVPGEPWHFSVTGAAMGARLPRFGGWHARGMDGMVSKPTLIGVGERGPERVKVTPAGKQSRGRGNIEVHIGNINYSRKGDVAKAIRAEMELLSDELAQMGDNE